MDVLVQPVALIHITSVYYTMLQSLVPFLVLILLGEEVFALIDIGLNSVFSRLPSGWTNFSMLIGELKGLHQAQGFINGATDWQIIDGNLPQYALVVNNEKTPVCNTLIFFKYTVVFRNGAESICHQRDIHWS